MNQYKKSNRLTFNDPDYIRPEKTITELVQNRKDIEEQLEDFEEIPEEYVSQMNVNTALKYLSYDLKNKKELFRFGGNLVKVEKDYLVLQGINNKRFCVQRYTRDSSNNIVHTTRFFKNKKESSLLEKQFNESYQEAVSIIEQQQKVIKKYEKKIASLNNK